jgi:hypothetical protein
MVCSTQSEHNCKHRGALEAAGCHMRACDQECVRQTASIPVAAKLLARRSAAPCICMQQRHTTFCITHHMPQRLLSFKVLELVTGVQALHNTWAPLLKCMNELHSHTNWSATYMPCLAALHTTLHVGSARAPSTLSVLQYVACIAYNS